ncbi:hypothetical protein ONZ43_g753 [Nemania bipapillata]|uniref:Uncharacterized protein n=1 Tax=Nemania bipapillata TaxID=110536 RepID=A0ACC2J7G4_9PEZI|nr:hypothetical protein ONZ43_g753 [Nemania bipapillata]
MDHLRVDPGGFQIPGMHPPPLMNQPPSIFGAYSHDGLPVLPPELAAQMGFDPSALLDDVNEAKRRRIARACDMCRKKKINAKYIEGLENRLARMESLLRLSGLLGEDDEATDLATLEKRLADQRQQSKTGSLASQASQSNPTSPSQATSGPDGVDSTPQSALTSPEPTKEREFKRDHSPPYDVKDEEEVAALSEMMCSLVTNQQGETRYIGSSSGFSIFSPKGIQWVNERTGDTSFQQMISEVSLDDHKWTQWKPEVFADLFHRPVFRKLPPKPEALSLLQDYFENFNCIFPLFHQPTFMHLVERQYSSNPYEGSGWWASLNCVFAIAHRLRVMSNLVPQEEDEKAWAYIKNAMGVFSELAMRNTDLLSVQALLGIALFMQGTPNPQPSFILVAAAIRLSHSIGLHKRGTGFNLNPIEIEQRKRVFWIAYMLDKDLCLRSGRPPAQDDDDMNVDLPDADPADHIGNIPLANGKGKMNLFRVMLSDGELLQTIGELDKELETWKDNIDIDYRPEHEIKASHTPLVLHIAMLHFSYYNALTTIHRDFSCVWMALYFPVSALVTLFGNILQNPNDPRARSDTRLMNLVVTFLSTLGQEAETGGVHRMLGVCSEFERIAKVVIEKAEKEAASRKKRKPADLNRQSRDNTNQGAPTIAARRASSSAATPTPNTYGSNISSNAGIPQLSPKFNGEQNRQNNASASTTPNSASHVGINGNGNGNAYSPMNTAASSNGSAPRGSLDGWPSEQFDPADLGSFAELTGFGQPMASPSAMLGAIGMNGTGSGLMGRRNGATGYQPTIPQDLWQLPMTLDWDWAEFTGGPYPGFENGSTVQN